MGKSTCSLKYGGALSSAPGIFPSFKTLSLNFFLFLTYKGILVV